MPQERILDRIVEKFVPNPVSQCWIVEVMQIDLPERLQQVQRRIVEQIVDVPGRQFLEDIVVVLRLAC